MDLLGGGKIGAVVGPYSRRQVEGIIAELLNYEGELNGTISSRSIGGKRFEIVCEDPEGITHTCEMHLVCEPIWHVYLSESCGCGKVEKLADRLLEHLNEQCGVEP